jgi:hypothetical protein
MCLPLFDFEAGILRKADTLRRAQNKGPGNKPGPTFLERYYLLFIVTLFFVFVKPFFPINHELFVPDTLIAR